MSVARLFQSLFIVVAHLATATIHLWWDDLPTTVGTLVKACLGAHSRSVLEGVARLHALVLVSFAFAVSFRITSALQLQAALEQHKTILTFDDVQTEQGWADVPSNYSFLDFKDFYVLRPSAPELEDRISKHDLNCAVSTPNALYGARPLPVQRLPSIQLHSNSSKDQETPGSFTIHSLKIKPLDMPLGQVKITLRGHQNDNSTLLWNVDFPAGFHDMLAVDLAFFSKKNWNKLKKVEISADFHYERTTMDWEFCVDDLQISFAE